MRSQISLNVFFENMRHDATEQSINFLFHLSVANKKAFQKISLILVILLLLPLTHAHTHILSISLVLSYTSTSVNTDSFAHTHTHTHTHKHTLSRFDRPQHWRLNENTLIGIKDEPKEVHYKSILLCFSYHNQLLFLTGKTSWYSYAIHTNANLTVNLLK